ncbi:hypothetical protein BZA05DRAFT_258340 [Tricharina praecox]|uniref:uncharacterized protein n=1 Tax=Tricharina praecox TaxID=43433 RepID=UPI00221E444F|nr:uncharacterized protein BZA05DRAFT_258340 [Tricharina praecox]KAI5854122.1 hypothetical protein BZA05DRAFT_258340 [Tricharina praecox]
MPRLLHPRHPATSPFRLLHPLIPHPLLSSSPLPHPSTSRHVLLMISPGMVLTVMSLGFRHTSVPAPHSAQRLLTGLPTSARVLQPTMRQRLQMRRLHDVIVTDHAVGVLSARVVFERGLKRVDLGRRELVLVVAGAIGGVLEGIESLAAGFILTIHFFVVVSVWFCSVEESGHGWLCAPFFYTCWRYDDDCARSRWP